MTEVNDAPPTLTDDAIDVPKARGLRVNDDIDVARGTSGRGAPRGAGAPV